MKKQDLLSWYDELKQTYQRFCGSMQLLAITGICLLTYDAGGQTPAVMSYYANTDLKGYSVEMVEPGAPTPGVVMAGTHFDVAGNGAANKVHFVRTDATGAVQAWTQFYEAGTGSDYIDERCVDIATVPGDYNKYYITSLVRHIPGSPNDKDKIKVYEVDYSGGFNPGNTVIIKSTDANQGNLYPQHSLYHNGFLYICGFTTGENAPTTYPDAPTWIPTSLHWPTCDDMPKEAFIIKYNLNTQNVDVFETYNYDYVSTPYTGFVPFPRFFDLSDNSIANFVPSSPYPPKYDMGTGGDWDMATRLTLLSNGQIHMTGAVSGMWAMGNGQWHHSGVMNITLDPNQASYPLTSSNNPFTFNATGGGSHIIGVGIVEANDGDDIMNDPSSVGMDGYYVMSNEYIPHIRPIPFLGGGGAGFEEGSMWPEMMNFYITYLGKDGNSNPLPDYDDDDWALWQGNPYAASPYNSGTFYKAAPPSTLRMGTNPQFRSWAINPVPCPSCNTYSDFGDKTFWIAGFSRDNPENNLCSYSSPISNANITPFLEQVRLKYDPGTAGGTGISWQSVNTIHHETLNGTGSGSFVSNSYEHIGRALSNIGYGPTMATMDPGTEDIIFTAPIWNSFYGRLNFKFIRAINLDGGVDDYAGNNACPGSTVPCGDTPAVAIATLRCAGIEMEPNFTDVDRTSNAVVEADATVWGTFSHTDLRCTDGGGPYYKSTGLINFQSPDGSVLVYPNPASDELRISTGKSMFQTAEARAELFNVYGQYIGNLYKGDAASLDNTLLHLPDLASGIYNLQLFADGKKVHQQKLTIKK